MHCGELTDDIWMQAGLSGLVSRWSSSIRRICCADAATSTSENLSVPLWATGTETRSYDTTLLSTIRTKQRKSMEKRLNSKTFLKIKFLAKIL